MSYSFLSTPPVGDANFFSHKNVFVFNALVLSTLGHLALFQDFV